MDSHTLRHSIPMQVSQIGGVTQGLPRVGGTDGQRVRVHMVEVIEHVFVGGSDQSEKFEKGKTQEKDFLSQMQVTTVDVVCVDQ